MIASRLFRDADMIVGAIEQSIGSSYRKAAEVRRRADQGENVEPQLERMLQDSLALSEKLCKTIGTFPEELAFRLRAILITNSRIFLELQMGLLSLHRSPWGAWRSPAVAAADFISGHAGEPRIPATEILSDTGTLKAAFRRASVRLHPDTGGDTRLMQDLLDARRTIDRLLTRFSSQREAKARHP